MSGETSLTPKSNTKAQDVSCWVRATNQPLYPAPSEAVPRTGEHIRLVTACSSFLACSPSRCYLWIRDIWGSSLSLSLASASALLEFSPSLFSTWWYHLSLLHNLPWQQFNEFTIHYAKNSFSPSFYLLLLSVSVPRSTVAAFVE